MTLASVTGMSHLNVLKNPCMDVGMLLAHAHALVC